ncbi:MAG: arylesterase, partial [Methyloligellaceae bacterium]
MSFNRSRHRMIRAANAFGSAALIALGVGLASFSHFAHADGEVVIVAFGDSLTAGYRLPPDKSFPAQLEAALKA